MRHNFQALPCQAPGDMDHRSPLSWPVDQLRGKQFYSALETKIFHSGGRATPIAPNFEAGTSRSRVSRLRSCPQRVTLGKVQAEQNESATPPSSGHKGRICRKSASGQKKTHAPQQSYTYSITSSALASNVGGISIPSAFAVLRLMINSNFVGCSTGRSAGFAPLSILST
jgi:hypothetical protein